MRPRVEKIQYGIKVYIVTHTRCTTGTSKSAVRLINGKLHVPLSSLLPWVNVIPFLPKGQQILPEGLQIFIGMTRIQVVGCKLTWIALRTIQ